MRIDVHYHGFEPNAETVRFQEKVLGLLKSLKESTDMSEALDRLTSEVAETKTAAQSAITLIQGLAQQIRDNATDPAALNALADSLDADQADIAAAVTENTPSS